MVRIGLNLNGYEKEENRHHLDVQVELTESYGEARLRIYCAYGAGVRIFDQKMSFSASQLIPKFEEKKIR